MRDLHTFLYIIRRIESRRKRENEFPLSRDNMRLGYLDFKRRDDLCKEKTLGTNLGLLELAERDITSCLDLRQIISRNYR